jgi:hypothetical protein
MDLIEQVGYLVPCAVVEIAGRFIGQKHTRRSDKRAGYDNALLLSARQLSGPVMCSRRKPYFR